MAKIGIYKITNPNQRLYVGQSTDIDARWKKYDKLHCKDQKSVYSSLLKYGPENHKFEVIELCKPEELDEREIFWGEKYDVLSNIHLNNRLGRGHGSYDSDETKLKKQLCHKGRNNYWLKGKKQSPETIAKKSASLTGVKQNRTKIRSDIGISRTCHIEGVVKAKSKPIIQYDKKGNIIGEYKSSADAARILGLQQPNINGACNKKNTYKGYTWKYK